MFFIHRISLMASENESKTILELANSLTLEQVQEQMALYHRMYHKLRKEQDPEYMKGKRQGTGTLLEGGRTNPKNAIKSILLLNL